MPNRTDKLVLLSLADNANDDGLCYPSRAQVAHKCQLKPRAVTKSIASLVACGIVRVRPRFSEDGQASNLYRIDAAALAKMAAKAATETPSEQWPKELLELETPPSTAVPAPLARRCQPPSHGGASPPSTAVPAKNHHGTTMEPKSAAGAAELGLALGAAPENAKSPKRALTDLWCSSYKEHFGRPYLFQGAKDGRAADRLLKAGLTPEEAVGIAQKAWSSMHLFNCKQAASLSGFAARFNEIRTEINDNGKSNTNPRNAGIASDGRGYAEAAKRMAQWSAKCVRDGLPFRPMQVGDTLD